MTTKPKPVTLFGRKMRHRIEPSGQFFVLGNATIYRDCDGLWWAEWVCGNGDVNFATDNFKSPHAAALALERKIESQWKRLGKLMGKGGKR